MHLFWIVLQIVIIEHKSIICPGYNAVLHIHTCIEEVEITVSVILSCDVNINNPVVEVKSCVMSYICRATNATKLQPWMEFLVSALTQTKMAVTFSIGLLKRGVSHDWINRGSFFIYLFVSMFFLRPILFVC